MSNTYIRSPGYFDLGRYGSTIFNGHVNFNKGNGR